MATVRRRDSRWQAMVRRKGHKPRSMVFDSKEDAKAWAARTEADIAAGRAGTPLKHTLAEAIDRYTADVAPTKRGKRWEVLRLAAIKKHDIAQQLVGEITPDDVSAWARARKVKPATVLREASVLSAVFTYARKTLRWIHASPMRDSVLPKTPKPRRQRLTDAQVAALVLACGYQGGEAQNALQRVAVALLFALETAMRAGEITGLRKSNVHPRHVHLPETKNGEARDVPLSKRARELLDCLPDADPVFGLKAASLDVLFRRVRAKAAESDPSILLIHFHDSRREAATRLSAKLDVMELARMGGWKNVNILYRTYYQPSLESLANKLD